MTVIAVIQARMGSSRLPGKVLLPLGDSTVLKTVVDRVRMASRVDKVVVATTMATADIEIERLCINNNIHCFRGSEADVLDRVYQAACRYRADHIVDITADCPLVDPRHIDRIVGDLLGCGTSQSPRNRQDYKGAPDYVSNCIERDWPDGLDIQAYSIGALEAVWRSMDSVREHVGWNIPQLAANLDLACRQIMAPRKYHLPAWGLTLDEINDYMLLKQVFAEMTLKAGSNLFSVEDCLDWLLMRPDVLAINAGVIRKERGRG